MNIKIFDPDEGRSPVKIKVELKEGEQEAQGPDTTMIEEGQEEIGNKPLPSVQPPKISEEPSTTIRSTCRKRTGGRQGVDMYIESG